jgi:hypothetical protein
MIAKDRRRSIERMLIALATAGAFATVPAWAQQQGRPRSPVPVSTPASGQPQQAQPAQGNPSALDAVNAPQPTLRTVAVPVNPSDPVAVINGEAVTRAQLADECVSRKGQEILETMIARKLIDQAIRARKMEVTAAEIDAEIEHVAQTVAGLGREAWLRTLDKERGISPVQYARDIIYPTLALRKLAAPQVQVTEQDLRDAFEAQFGEKLRCRIIMVDKLRVGQDVWEELKKNPGGFEKVAQTQSIDVTSRSLGGLLGEPITRHAHPRNVSDAAFLQLVDGDPKDQDPTHKPKDGDFTGPIQVAESNWVIIRREGLIPAQGADFKDPAIRKMLHEMMFEAKVKSKMGDVYQELFRSAAIENRLTGGMKLANEEQRPEHQVDGNVSLMSNPGAAAPASNAPAADAAASSAKPKGTTQPPAGLSTDTAKRAKSFTRPLKPKSDSTAAPATTQPNQNP